MSNAENVVFIAPEATADPVPSMVVPMTFTGAPNALTPMDLVDRALASGAGFEIIGKMLDYQERVERAQARRAFDAAIAAAKAELPIIIKNRKGHNTKYADLAAIVSVVDPILARHGLTQRANAQQEGTQIKVTCLISHTAGHREETTLASAADTSGAKNAIQAVGSALTYLHRYSLMLALGLASSDDDDGHGAGASAKISAEDVETLALKLEATKSNVPAFLKLFGIAELADMLAKDLDRATVMLERKAQGK